jgi:hypothetical protein
MPTIFISHRSEARATAIQFKELLMRGSSDLEVFLSSDWESIPAGSNWLQEIERALTTHTHFVALITQDADSRLPWICYEVGYARGRGLLPKIFVFGGIEPRNLSFPIAGIHLVGTWDTNRWTSELLSMGVSNVSSKEHEFATLFNQ